MNSEASDEDTSRGINDLDLPDDLPTQKLGPSSVDLSSNAETLEALESPEVSEPLR